MTEPIGAPSFCRTEEREYYGPTGWSVPRRAQDLALVLQLEVESISVTVRPAGSLERVTVRVRGDVRRLDRYWDRLGEVADAAGGTRGTGWDAVRAARRWSLRAVLAGIFSSS